MVIEEPMTSFLLEGDYVAHMELLMDVPFYTSQNKTRVGGAKIPAWGALGYTIAHFEFLILPPIYWHVEHYGLNNRPTHFRVPMVAPVHGIPKDVEQV